MAHAKLEAFPDETVALARFARALSHPARIAILSYLRDHGEVPCMAIVGSLPLSQAASSRHVNELLKAELVKARPHRNQIHYSIDPARIHRFCDAFGIALK